MTSCGINFRFRLLVAWLSAHGRDASSCKIWCRYLYPMRSYWHFFEIQDGGRRHLGFSDYVNLAIRVCWQCGNFVLYQIGLKYVNWLLRSTHLCFRGSFDDVMRINFRFRLLVTWSYAHGHDASSCKIWCRYLYPVRSYWNSRSRRPPSWIFSLSEFGYSGVFTVWYLCSVPNWVKIYALFTEIDALMLQTFIWWRHAN